MDAGLTQALRQEAPRGAPGGPRSRVVVRAPAQVERHTQPKETLRLERRHLPPLGMDALGAGEAPVVEAVPAVPAGAIGANLHEPRPRARRRGFDRDRHRRAVLAARNEIGARVRPPHLLGRRPASRGRTKSAGAQREGHERGEPAGGHHQARPRLVSAVSGSQRSREATSLRRRSPGVAATSLRTQPATRKRRAMNTGNGLHVVVGTGPLGLAVVRRLVRSGERVRAVNRSGQAELPERVELVSADASDGASLVRALAGATVLYHCASTLYHTWPKTLPPIMAAVIEAAAAAGARIVYGDNLYAYGPVAGRSPKACPTGRGERTGARARRSQGRSWRRTGTVSSGRRSGARRTSSGRTSSSRRPASASSARRSRESRPPCWATRTRPTRTRSSTTSPPRSRRSPRATRPCARSGTFPARRSC